jgi:uncharacterized protein (TIGR02266 family)
MAGMTASRRQHQRFDVRLSVSYRTAAEYVHEYAHNLSAGGLFVGGACELEPLSTVTIDLELPGFQRFQVKAQVVHVVTAHESVRSGRPVGAGLALLETSEAFRDALHQYLLRLGRRRDATVLVSEPHIGGLLENAGFQVQQLAAPGDILSVVARTRPRVMAILVEPGECDAYVAALAPAGEQGLVAPLPVDDDIGPLLRRLDELL